jgi:hypothetical protein
MKNKKLIAILTALVLVFGLESGYSGDTARTGTAAGMQLTVPVGARYLAMAGSNIADVQGVDALYWNPAGLSSMTSSAAGVFSTMTIFNDVSVNYMGLGFRMGETGSLGISLKSIDFGDIPFTTEQDPDGASGQTFSPTFVTVGLTYSTQLTNVIQVGLTAKIVSESVDRASASAFAFDAGIQYHDIAGFNGLSFGLAVKNVGTSMQYSGSAFTGEGIQTGGDFPDFYNSEAAIDDLPASFEIGLGYKYSLDEQNSLFLASNFDNFNYGADAFKFGAEYTFNDMLFLRAGYIAQTDIDAKDQLYRYSAGVGFKYNLGGADLTLDYSFRDSQYFDGNNLFSLQIGF